MPTARVNCLITSEDCGEIFCLSIRVVVFGTRRCHPAAFELKLGKRFM